MVEAKNIALIFGVLWLIYIVIQLFSPFLATNFWDWFRSLFGLSLIFSGGLHIEDEVFCIIA